MYLNDYFCKFMHFFVNNLFNAKHLSFGCKIVFKIIEKMPEYSRNPTLFFIDNNTCWERYRKVWPNENNQQKKLLKLIGVNDFLHNFFFLA